MSKTKAEILWDSVSIQLQMEMPRATFRRWIEPVTAISLDDDTLILGAPSAEAAAWLENRGTAVIKRILLGLTGQKMTVQFTVLADGETMAAEDALPVWDDDDDLDIVPEEASSLYTAIVQPHKVTVLPGYFRRWLPILGPELGWFYVAFRQSAYTNHGRTGQYSSRIAGQDLARLSGTTERTVWRRLGSPKTWQKLGYLVQRETVEKEWVHQDGRLQRRAIRYKVAMDLPLTPADTASLRTWLRDKIRQYGLVEALKMASAAAAAEMLSGSGNADQALTVYDLVRELAGNNLDTRTVRAYATTIQARIMPPHDQIVIPLFFLENVLPHMKPGFAWLWVLLRDRCWEPSGNEDARDTVTVAGGYQELANWLGLRRSKTVWEWLREPIASVFLRVEKTQGREVEFRVLLNAIPLEIFHLRRNELPSSPYTLGLAQITQDDMENKKLASFLEGLTSLVDGANVSIEMAQMSVSDGANVSIEMAQMSVSDGANVRVKALNPVNKPLNPVNPPDQSSNLSLRGAGNENFNGANAPRSGFQINLEQLFQNAKINPSSREKLKKAGVTGEAFISWLLYGYQEPGIAHPLRLAIALALRQPEGAKKYLAQAGNIQYLVSAAPQEVKSILFGE